jgi:hypothetical protein
VFIKILSYDPAHLEQFLIDQLYIWYFCYNWNLKTVRVCQTQFCPNMIKCFCCYKVVVYLDTSSLVTNAKLLVYLLHIMHWRQDWDRLMHWSQSNNQDKRALEDLRHAKSEDQKKICRFEDHILKTRSCTDKLMNIEDYQVHICFFSQNLQKGNIVLHFRLVSLLS